MGTKGTRPERNENPWKILYWMGAGLLVLALGVVALILLVDTGPRERPPFERTILWIYPAEAPGEPGLVTLLEEGHETGTLTAVIFPAPDEAMAVFKNKDHAKRAQEAVEGLAGRAVHHRVFLSDQVISTLVDSVAGIQLNGRDLNGPDSLAYIREGGAQAPGRAFAVLMAMADVAMNERAPNISAGEALALARQMETDLDLAAIPEVLQRWSGYANPQIVSLPAFEAEEVQKLLQPDLQAPATQAAQLPETAQSTAAEAPVVSPSTGLSTLTGEPVDWIRGEELATRPGVCQPQQGSPTPVAVQVRQVEWRRHPLAEEPFWVPTVTFVLCNQSTEATKNLFLSLDRTVGDMWDPTGSIGPFTLQPGDGVGPIRFFASEGLPARILAGYEEGTFPDWHYRLSLNKSSLVEFGGAGEARRPEVSFALLRSQTWDRDSFRTEGGEHVDLFLYSPDAQYSVQTTPYCGAAEGQINASGRSWALYARKDDGAAVRLLELGQYLFGGGRGMRVENAPGLKTTFVALEQYGSCAVPMTHDLYGYDHTTGEAYRVKARDEKGHTGAMTVAAFAITPEGKLEDHFYLNAGDQAGWHTVIYRWVAEERTWVEESHSVSKQP